MQQCRLEELHFCFKRCSFFLFGYTGRICGNIPIIPYEFPLIHAVDPTATDQTADCGEKALPEAEGQSYRRELNWYRGRRPRTAFTHIQQQLRNDVSIGIKEVKAKTKATKEAARMKAKCFATKSHRRQTHSHHCKQMAD
nr:PREDICTED: homeobox expressed in ES cells 1 isoform X2 [Latimeria chalumnae]|eukprot:XP_006005824.1 PREDICTED: homeobox expressed in ES cells 1 isoform X2 [Latimeria chalumnae]